MLPRQIRRQDGGKRPHRPSRDQDAQQPSRGGEQKRLGQKLLQQTAAAGPQRRAHRQFLAAGRRARHQQSGDVGAGHQQQQADRPQQRQQSRTHVSHQGVGERHGGKVAEVHLVAELLPDLTADCADVGAGLG